MWIIDLQKLRHAVAISRAGSYNAAAREICISQSALTRSVNLLEETYGVRLFERGRSGAKLTLEGAQFIKVAEDALRGAQIAHEQTCPTPRDAGAAGKLRNGSDDGNLPPPRPSSPAAS